MNYCVPDFGIEEEDPFASSLRFPNRKLLQDEGDDDISEILWQKGPILRRFPPPDRSFDDNQNRVGGADAAASAPGELFMGEDEMASWLHYSPEHTTANAETDNQQVLDRNRTIMAPPSSLQPSTTSMLTQPRLAGSQLVASRASTVVESNVVVDMAPPPLESRSSTEAVTRRNDIPRVSEKVGAPSSIPMHGDDRKRKSRDSDDSDGEDADYDSDDKKKDSRRPARRSRAAEVHNLSERRRRDRINEKMKALQQLIPRCNKSDKASMLDDAVEYLKSLQLQIQMMSMGCQMNPMMYSGIPQYAAPMGMPMSMGVDHTMLQFQQVMQGGTVPAATAAHLSSRLPMPAAFHPAAMAAVNGQLRAQTTTGHQSDPQPNFFGLRGPNPAVMPNLTNPYTQQYYGFQLPSQSQAATEPSSDRTKDKQARTEPELSSTKRNSESKLG